MAAQVIIWVSQKSKNSKSENDLVKLTIRSQFDQMLASSCRSLSTALAETSSSCLSARVIFAELKSNPRAGW